MPEHRPFQGDFDKAKHWKLPFGKYKGKTLDEVAVTDSGLQWLKKATSLEIAKRLSADVRDALKRILEMGVEE